jgi:hypothetical protein
MATTFGRIARVAALAAVVAAVLALVYKVLVVVNAGGNETVGHWPGVPVALTAYFLPVALPLIAGVANSLYTALDVGRRKVRYAGMAENLATAHDWIEVIDTLPHLRRAVARTEEILLDEQVEWLAASESGQGH